MILVVLFLANKKNILRFISLKCAYRFPICEQLVIKYYQCFSLNPSTYFMYLKRPYSEKRDRFFRNFNKLSSALVFLTTGTTHRLSYAIESRLINLILFMVIYTIPKFTVFPSYATNKKKSSNHHMPLLQYSSFL